VLVDAAQASAGQSPQDAKHYMRSGSLQLHSLPPLSLYVHLPWCIKKCPYCDFNSHEVIAPKTPRASALPAGISELERSGAAVLRSGLPQARYIDALMADLEASLPCVWGRGVHSIFLGGGTPSLFDPDAVDALLAGLRARLPLEPGCEISMEANPGTFERERFAAYAQAGVTRLSVGVQSFNDTHLRALGRVHDRTQALAAVEEAARAFQTFNLDLMYALPGQSLEQLQDDLETALTFAPPHLSVYHLTIEPNTLFAKYPPQVPADDDAYDMLDAITERTAALGLQRYEVSAYAQDAHRCRHNLNYWGFGDYLGIGAGAHSKLSFAHRVVRQVRLRDPQRYMQQALLGRPIALEEDVARSDLAFEFMLNALRLRHGFALRDFTERTGLGVNAIEAGLREAEAKGLVERDFARVRPTQRGFDFLSDLQALFLSNA